MNTTATRQTIEPATLTAYGAARLVKVDHAHTVDVERQIAFVDVSDFLPAGPLDEGDLRTVAFDVAREYDGVLYDTATTIGDEVDGLPIYWVIVEADFAHVLDRMEAEARCCLEDHGRYNRPTESEWDRRATRRTERAVVTVTR